MFPILPPTWKIYWQRQHNTHEVMLPCAIIALSPGLVLWIRSRTSDSPVSWCSATFSRIHKFTKMCKQCHLVHWELQGMKPYRTCQSHLACTPTNGKCGFHRRTRCFTEAFTDAQKDSNNYQQEQSSNLLNTLSVCQWYKKNNRSQDSNQP